MKRFRVLVVAVLLMMSHSLSAQEKWWLTDWQAHGFFNKSLSFPKGTRKLFKDALVADVAFGFSTKMLKFKSWDLGFVFQFQSLYGGFQNRRAKIYVTDYLIEIPWRMFISKNGLYISASLFHRSSHESDKIVPQTPQEVLDLQSVSIDVEDINLLRFGIGQETGNYEWHLGLQPLKLNYFIVAEAGRMLKQDSYVPYTHRFYGSGIYTIWRNDDRRVSCTLIGDLEEQSRYIVAIQYGTRLGKMPNRDQIQLQLGYEGGGGINKNQIQTTPYAGLTSERWFLGFAFSFSE